MRNPIQRNRDMKKAFTLIELLVVIAIIAILAAILFPVFAQAKLAAKKIAGLTQAKQIGTASQLYLGDYDDVWFPYRVNGPTGSSGCAGVLCINTDYQKLIATKGQPFADGVFGTRARDVNFFKQLLDPYTKNEDIFKSPGKSPAWAGYDPSGSDTDTAFRSYGGNNSYGLNNFLFVPVPGTTISSTSVAEVSNTLMMVDASYYNVLPRGVRMLKGQTFDPCTSRYMRYWKSLGNSYLFHVSGEPTDAAALKLIDQRFNGQLNAIRADTSAKSLASNSLLTDFITKGVNGQSMWDPFKQGPVDANYCY